MVSYSSDKPRKGDLRFVKTTYIDTDTGNVLKEKSMLQAFDGSYWNSVPQEDAVVKASLEDFNKYYKNN